MERENDRRVPFLDTHVIRADNNILILDGCTKLSSSSKSLNHTSNHTESMNANLVLGLKNRITKISHPSLEDKNEIIKHNSYPF